MADSSLRFGLFVEGQNGVPWETWLRLAEAVRAAGFEALLQSDHSLPTCDSPGTTSLDAWAVVVGLAARVDDLRFGTLVSPVGFRHPVTLARLAAAADEISGGRIDVGLGAGWFELEHVAHGFEFPELAERFDRLGEELVILRGLWSGERFSSPGPRYRLVDAPPLPAPAQRGGPTLLVGAGGGARSVALAGAWADEYNTRSASSEVCRNLRSALDKASVAAGREPDDVGLSLLARCIMGDTDAAVESAVERAMRHRNDSGDPMAWVESRRSRCLVGTPEEVCRQLDLLQAAGADRVIFQLDDPTDLANVEALGSRVLSRFARAQPHPAGA